MRRRKSRNPLATLAAPAKPAPSISASVGPWRPAIPNDSATSAAPVACPISRAVAMIPLAPPLRSGGALDISAFRFGDWKKPKPAPHSIIRQPMSMTPGAAGNAASDTMPALSNARPIAPSRPGG